MSIGDTYESLWTQYRDADTTYTTAVQHLCEQERTAIPTDKDWRYAFKPADTPLSKIAEDILKHLLYEASERFAPHGSPRLTLPEDDLLHEFLGSRNHHEQPDWTAFSPVHIWNTLTQRYSGTQGRHLGYEQAARGLVQYFDIRTKLPLASSSRPTILSVSMWIDHFDKKYGKAKLSYSCRDSLTKALSHLTTFLAWANVNPNTKEMAILTNYQYEIHSHEKIHCSSDLDIVTYQSKFEWRFSSRLAELLQVFLATYATEPT